MSSKRPTRRLFIRRTGAAAASLGLSRISGQTANRRSPGGMIKGEPTAEKAGQQILADGGNAFDAIVAAAMTAAIAAPYQTGIGGYGGGAVLATSGGTKIAAVDFNSAAPSAATSDMFHGASGLKDHRYGWRAAGVPGILAGLQLILERYGSRSFSDVAQPAIRLAREGIPMQGGLASTVQAAAAHFRTDPGSRNLYLRNDAPLPAGEQFCNPALAEMLVTLAERGSVESFYRGDIAETIARSFAEHGGLVTAKDLAEYQAREVPPLVLNWGEFTIHTPPLTAGGLTVLQALSTLAEMKWDTLAPEVRTHARIEALRLAWRDRLTLLGDPAASAVPVDRLLSPDYARESAERILAAVKLKTILHHDVRPRSQSGTIHLSASDNAGNFVALTLTHGESFGARVTVRDLGLTLGHGMSRFETIPDHPNAPGPGKRPLHNMCPTIVSRDGKAVLALGARGGRRIPNAVFEVLTQFVGLGHSFTESIAAPRLHTEGTPTVEFEKHWPQNEIQDLPQCGYTVETGGAATVSAVAGFNDELTGAMR